MKKITCVVIDDEKSIRKALTDTLQESEYFSIIGEADDVSTAANAIQELEPDLVFMDIKLIGGTAFEVIEILKKSNHDIPPLVVNTAFNDFDYASRFLNNYKDLVLMILKKPFWEFWDEKEEEIINKYYEYQNKNNIISKSDKLILKSERNSYLIRYEDLFLCEVSDDKSQGKLVLHSKKQRYEVYRTLNNMMQDLKNREFIRVSRYAAINARYISHYDHTDQMVFLHDFDRGIGVGNAYKEGLMECLS